MELDQGPPDLQPEALTTALSRHAIPRRGLNLNTHGNNVRNSFFDLGNTNMIYNKLYFFQIKSVINSFISSDLIANWQLGTAAITNK